MFSIADATRGDQIVRVFDSHPQLAAFFGCLVFLTVVIALLAYRRHRIKFRRVRSPTGATGTSLDIVPVREYPPIEGFEDSTVVIDWPAEHTGPQRKRGSNKKS